MRSVVNISLPPTMMEWVKAEMKARQFTSVSEFFRSIIRDYQEEKLLAELRESEKDVAEGRVFRLDSMSQLDAIDEKDLK